MNRNFNEWFRNFKTSISTYDYYVDFEKVYELANRYRIEISILNSLIGVQDIERMFKDIVAKYPDTLEVIPLLLAVRANEIFVKDDEAEFVFCFDGLTYDVEKYVEFMRKTGLFDLLQRHIINNLYDYLLGIEVGLDSNARKNRGGHLMENLVEKYIVEAGYVRDVNYFKEMYLTEIEERWNVDLSAMSGDNTSTKRFDFVIKTDNQIYVIEANFYASHGSKLNETARSYKMLAEEADVVDGVTFIWFTDGTGWNDAKRNLEETFNVLDTLYNINDLENGVLNSLQ